jgi:hypothetical protein
MRQTSGAELVACCSEWTVQPILPYKGVLSIRIVLARRIKYRVGRCRMKEYREGKGLRIQCTLPITIVEASRTTIEGNADLKRGSVRTDFVSATSMYFLSAQRQADSFRLTVLVLALCHFVSQSLIL